MRLESLILERERDLEQVGLVISDPLRLLGMEAIVEDLAHMSSRSLSLSGLLHSFEVKLAVVDISTVVGGADTLATVRRQRPEMHLVILGPMVELEMIQEVIGAGAKGYLTLDARETEVVECLEVVRDGGIWAPRKVLARLIAQGTPGRSPLSRFTDREDQVLELLIEGKPNRDIALDLGIDEGTVKAHVSRLMRKVGVGNRTALTMAVIQMRSGKPASPCSLLL